MANDPNDKVSSIVMKAIDAKTFAELQAFTKDLESRPMERLLRDVAELVKPSESKAQIVSYVIATKYRRADAGEKLKVLQSLDKTIDKVEAGEQRDRIQFVIDRLRNQES